MTGRANGVANTYNEISQLYATQFNSPSEKIDDFLKLIKTGGKILDAGCGPGIDSDYMQAKGYDVIGVDISKDMIEMARKKNAKVCFKKADIRQLRFKPNAFDGIIASFSIIHIPKDDLSKTISDFYKFLKLGGIIYLGVQEGISQEVIINEPLKIDEELFLNIVSTKELEDLLKDIGFKILSESIRPPENKEELEFNKLIVIAKKK